MQVTSFMIIEVDSAKKNRMSFIVKCVTHSRRRARRASSFEAQPHVSSARQEIIACGGKESSAQAEMG